MSANTHTHTHTHTREKKSVNSCLKFLLSFVFLMIFGLGFSQSPFNTNLSPGGLLENVFDNYGNNYKLADIKIINANIPTTSRSVLVVCNPTSIFNLYFEPGCGMEGSSTIETDRQIGRAHV